MKAAAPALLLLLGACDIAGDCLPAALSPQRERFRQQLGEIVYVSQCPGPLAPRALARQEQDYLARKQQFLARAARSRLASDLAEARRKFQEYTRNAFEAECALLVDDYGSQPEDLKEFAAQLEAKEAKPLHSGSRQRSTQSFPTSSNSRCGVTSTELLSEPAAG